MVRQKNKRKTILAKRNRLKWPRGTLASWSQESKKNNNKIGKLYMYLVLSETKKEI